MFSISLLWKNGAFPTFLENFGVWFLFNQYVYRYLWLNLFLFD